MADGSPTPVPTLASAQAEIVELRNKLAQAERERALFIQHSADGFWDWHLADDHEYMSPRFWEIFGYAPEEKSHHPSAWQEMIHPEDLTLVKVRLDAHIASRGATAFDEHVRYRHKKGHWVTVRCRGKVVEWAEDGSPHRIVGTHTDVTTLIEARSRAEILYSASSVGIWDWIDVTATREFWSEEFYRLIGYASGELEPTLENFRKLLHPDDVERTFAMVDAHLSGESSFGLDYRLLHKSGEYRWFRGQGKAVFNENGVVRMVGSIQDIHQERLAEERMQALALRHELSLRASGIGIWDLDVRENILLWDDQMYSLYGVTAEEFSSAYEAWVAGVHPLDRAEGQRQIELALSGEKDFDTQFRVIKGDGSIRSIRAMAVTLRDENGNPTRIVGANWDVTEREEAEGQLKSTAEELRATNTELERFVYFASHDLQAPIRHISAFTQLLSMKHETDLDDESKEWFGFVASGATRMHRLVQDLLAYARAGNEAWAPKSIALDVLVREVQSMLRNDDGTPRIRVTSASLPEVIGHASQIQQVLQNLLENAAKYARDGVPAEAEVSVEDTPTHWVLKVRDNGKGIAPHLTDRIFEPFQKLSADDPTSSGIGLAICTKVAQRHGGEMSVESEPGVGSTFAMSVAKAV